MIRVVVDTNIILSGLFWRGIPGQVYDAAVTTKYTLIVSEDVIAELSRVLQYPKFVPHLLRSGKTVDGITMAFSRLAELVIPMDIPLDAVRDPKDRPILACAVGGHADYIVSGDKDLLILGQYQGIPIVSAEQFLRHLSSLPGKAE